MKNAKKCEICGADVYPQNEVNNGVGIENILKRSPRL
jgi:predicted nucleic-acid-binding Zn-ribbon protein